MPVIKIPPVGNIVMAGRPRTGGAIMALPSRFVYPNSPDWGNRLHTVDHLPARRQDEGDDPSMQSRLFALSGLMLSAGSRLQSNWDSTSARTV